MQGYKSEEDVVKNLQDAGCDAETISTFVEDFRNGELKAGIHMLKLHRRTLLEDLHKGQKQIDCLDYLVYQMEKQAKTNISGDL